MKAMRSFFASVVTSITGASIFVEVIKCLGGIAVIPNALATVNTPFLTSGLMSLIAFLAGIVMGSGIASWHGCGALIPDIALKTGVSALSIALPMEIASGIGRCMSPAAAVVIAVTGMGDLKLADVVKRCVVPCIFLFVANLVMRAVVGSLL